MSRNTPRKSPERPSECYRLFSVRAAFTYRIAIVSIIFNDKLLGDSKVLMFFQRLKLSYGMYQNPKERNETTETRFKVHLFHTIYIKLTWKEKYGYNTWLQDKTRNFNMKVSAGLKAWRKYWTYYWKRIA